MSEPSDTGTDRPSESAPLPHDSAEAARRRAEGTVARGSAINLAGYVLGFLEPLFMLVISRLLGAGRLGSYILATSYAALLLRLGVMGLDKGLLRHIAISRAGDTPEPSLWSVLGTALRWILGLSVCAMVLLFGLADLVVAADGSDKAGDAAIWIRIIVFAVPGEALVFYFLFALRGIHNMWAFVLVRNVLSPLFLFVIALPGILLGASPEILMFAYLGSQYLSAGVAYVIYRRAFPTAGLLRILRAPRDRSLLAFAFPQGITEFLNLLLARADILMIAYFFHDQPELVAIYGVASLLSGMVKKVRQGFDISLAPVLSDLIARGERDVLVGTYQKVSRWIYSLWFPVAGVIAFGGALILAAYGPAYTPFWTVVPILVVAKLLNSAGGPAQTALLMAGRSALELLNTVLVILLNIALNLLLIPRHGIYGAAIAALISLSLFNLVRIIQVWRILRIAPRPSDVLRVSLAGGIASAVGAGVLVFAPGGLWRFGLATALFLALYPAALIGVGLREDLQAVGAWLRRKKPADPRAEAS